MSGQHVEQWTIQNGLIYDGSGAPPFRGDVELSEGLITHVGEPRISPANAPTSNGPTIARQFFDATDYIVAPGLIDLHVHVYDGMNLHSVSPADAGLKTGVTTMLDMGSAGAMNYGTFHKYVIPHAAETVLSLLNISQFGVQGHPDIMPYLGDLHDPQHFNVDTAVHCIQSHPGEIIGVKVRLTASLADNDSQKERTALAAALTVRDQTGLPCYVHHVMSSIPLDELLSQLKAGDVLTHFYHGMGDGGFTSPDGGPGRALTEARERGIMLDVGHGSGCFMWRIAESACRDHHFWPDSISTDIHVFNIAGPVVDMPTTMSKFLYLGMSMEEVVRCSTLAPATIMGQRGHYGRLQPGYRADVTMLQLVEGAHELIDSEGVVRVAQQRLVPICTFKDGKRYDCHPNYASSSLNFVSG